MEYSYEDLAFMSFITQGSNTDMYTIYIRLKDKVGVIEHTNANGELLEPRKEKIIKTSSFGPFMVTLEALGVLNWPRHKDDERQADRQSNVLTYSFKTADSEYIDYNTKGNNPEDFEALHKAIEVVLGESFGKPLN